MRKNALAMSIAALVGGLGVIAASPGLSTRKDLFDFDKGSGNTIDKDLGAAHGGGSGGIKLNGYDGDGKDLVPVGALTGGLASGIGNDACESDMSTLPLATPSGNGGGSSCITHQLQPAPGGGISHVLVPSMGAGSSEERQHATT